MALYMEPLLSSPMPYTYLHLEKSDGFLEDGNKQLDQVHRLILKKSERGKPSRPARAYMVKVYFSPVPISLNGQLDSIYLTHPDLLKTISQKPRSCSTPTAGIGLSLMYTFASVLYLLPLLVASVLVRRCVAAYRTYTAYRMAG